MTTVTQHQQRGVQIWIIAAVAIGFGLLTIKQGGTVLFGSDASRAAAGNYVPAVLWFNFLAGFAYAIAGIGLWLRQRWAVWLAVAIAVATALTFTAFGVYIFFGLAYEERTVMAMGLRTLVWAVIAAVVWRSVAYRSV